MNIISFFTNNGTPQTGLSPKIDIWKLDGTQVINNQSCTEIAGGFYYYNFTTYDEDVDYCIRVDGTATLSGNDRYQFSTNETAGVGNILKISKNNWKIKNNQMLMYDDDGVTALYTFNLKDAIGNPSSNEVFERDKI